MSKGSQFRRTPPESKNAYIRMDLTIYQMAPLRNCPIVGVKLNWQTKSYLEPGNFFQHGRYHRRLIHFREKHDNFNEITISSFSFNTKNL